ncbi:PREDICTED: probable G-protein coupled receptor 179 [Mesitornis unicolor]|uniref:probable G-protein coupled receptor 179 n=1 Tax=Mesitornis unicolor TaxID=54374 RepID=UPI000528915B|nr:PREDICTED: probable G-protein coupled receptor 179 [Mesitornis unicolor]
MGGRRPESRDTGKFAKLMRKSLEIARSQAKKSQIVESIKEEICPWESQGMEKYQEKPHAGSSALLKSPSKKSQSGESLKAEVCPWEEQEVKSPDKAEICPWETAAPPSGKEKLREEKGVLSVERSPPTGQGVHKEIGDSAAAKKEKGSRGHESICPWESPDMEKPAEKLHIRTPALPKSPSKKSQSKESLKTEICPWEAEEAESTDKAEICPWEVAAPSSAKEKSRKDKDALSTVIKIPATGQGVPKETGDSAAAKKEKGSGDRESVCPWESTDMEKPAEKPQARIPALPKSPSKKSQSEENLKTEICPWEAQEAESTNKAEICPWEVAAPSSAKEKPRKDKDALSTVIKIPATGQGVPKEIGDSAAAKKEKGSGDRESVCPWESTDMDQPSEKPRTRIPVLPKSTSRKSQSKESLKAEICPWEVQEVEATDKAEICPWESVVLPSAPSDEPEGKQGPGGAAKGDKRFTRQAALGSPARSVEQGSSEREAVCPWESLGTEQPQQKPRGGSPAGPKSASKKSQSGESLKAEVCPWEAQEAEATDKAEICPWETAVLPSSKEKSRQDKDVLSTVIKSPPTSQGVHKETGDSAAAKKEKGSGDRESVCPWESTDTEQPPEKPRTRIPVLPKSTSRKSQSKESLKAEICPWEAQEAEATDKAEICPWEVTAALPEKGAALGDVSVLPQKAGPSKALEKGSSEREAVCPWESLGLEEPSPKTATGKEPSDSTESWKSDVCPWEAAEPTGSEKTHFSPGMHPPGDGGASPTGTGKSKLVSPTAPLKKPKGRSTGEAGHKPLCRVVPGIQPPTGPRAQPPGESMAPTAGSSPGTATAEVCPWEAEEALPASDQTSTDTRRPPEVCPWEVESMDPTRSSQDRDRGASETKPDVCPWDHE